MTSMRVIARIGVFCWLHPLHIALVLCAVSSSSLAHAQNAREYRCDYATGFECDVAGCSKHALGQSYILIPHPDSLVSRTNSASHGRHPLPAIRRCDRYGCTTVQVRAAQSTQAYTLDQVDGSYFLQIASLTKDSIARGEFLEVVPLPLATITYFGRCHVPPRQ